MLWVLESSFEHPKHMLKLMGKKILTITGPFPAILGKGPWLELGKNMPHSGFWVILGIF